MKIILKWMLKMKNLYAVSTSMDTAGVTHNYIMDIN